MKAIQTRYLPPALVRGARIKAWAEGGHSVTIPYPHEYSGARVHAEAACALCRKMGWEGELVSGGLPDQSGYVFCFAASERFGTSTREQLAAEARRAPSPAVTP